LLAFEDRGNWQDLADKKWEIPGSIKSVRGFLFPGHRTTIRYTEGGIMMLRYVLIFALSVMTMLPGMAWSGEEAQDNKNTFILDEIVVSATKTQEKTGDVPNSVILISKDDIANSPALSLGDALGNETGIDLRTHGDFGGATEEIHIRGMGADGTQVLVNGVVVNSPSLGSADVSGISLNNIEKIEVVKGSGSLLYGSGAMAGTVNILTKSPVKGSKDLELSAGYGSNSSYDLAVGQGMFLTNNFGYYITANKRETDGFRSNSWLDHKDASLKLVYHADGGPEMTLYGDYLDRSFGSPGVKPPAGTVDFFVNGIKLYDSESANLLNEGGEKDKHLAFEAAHSPLEWLKVSLKGTYADMESYNKNVYNFFGLSGSKTWVVNKIEGVEANADMELFNGMNLLAGGEYKKYKWENRNIYLDENIMEISGTETTTDAQLHTYGLFAEAQYRPVERVKLVAGLRDENHSEFGSKIVQRYGLVLNPEANTAFKFNFGQHFNAPTPNALFWPYEDWGWGMGTQGNRNLKPESGRHMDAGIEHGWLDNKMFMDITWFKWDIANKISWVPDASFFYTPQNLDRYKSQGLEVSSNIGPYYDMTLSLSYTYTKADEKLFGGVTRQALYTSENNFKSTLRYADERGFTAEATVRYTGDRPGYYTLSTDIKPSVTLASYSTVDVKAEQAFMRNWLVSLQCNNILDKAYDTYTESFMDQNSGDIIIGKYPGAGRSLLLKVGYKF
jgi:outer membrane cobalamin receptor